MTYKYNSVCIKVVDGDTIDAFVDLGFEIWIKKRIRLYDIDTPETRTKNLAEKQKGLEAKSFLTQILEKNNFKFILLSHGVGKYGRCLGELFIDEESVNELLIKEGHAKKYKE